MLVATGFIIFRKFCQQIEYLLLQTSYGSHHWTPPKGHVDAGEDELTTAYRETLEEAGITADHLNVIQDFKKILQYDVQGKPKRVVYWLAELRDAKTPVVLSEEHQDYKWLNLESAVTLAGYADLQQTLREASLFIETRCKGGETVR